MPRLNYTLVLVLSSSLILPGCGGSTADDTDGGVSGGYHAGTGGHSGTGGATNVSCDVVSATAAQVNLCQQATDCAKAQCVAEITTCLGAGYASGVYAGAPCSGYADCAKNCNCDATCMGNNCRFDEQACGTCLLNELGVCVAQGSCAPIAAKCLLGG